MNPLPSAYGWLDELRPLPRMLEEARKLYGTFEVAGPASNPLILDWAKEVGLARTYLDDGIPWCGLFMAVVEPHPRWFETNPGAVAADLRAVIDAVAPVEILAALPPPPVPGVALQPRGGNLSFYRPHSEWLGGTAVTILPFAEYEAGLRQLVDQFGGDGASVEIPQINAAAGLLPVLSMSEAELVRAYYREDLPP